MGVSFISLPAEKRTRLLFHRILSVHLSLESQAFCFTVEDVQSTSDAERTAGREQGLPSSYQSPCGGHPDLAVWTVFRVRRISAEPSNTAEETPL